MFSLRSLRNRRRTPSHIAGRFGTVERLEGRQLLSGGGDLPAVPDAGSELVSVKLCAPETVARGNPSAGRSVPLTDAEVSIHLPPGVFIEHGVRGRSYCHMELRRIDDTIFLPPPPPPPVLPPRPVHVPIEGEIRIPVDETDPGVYLRPLFD